MMSSTRVVLAVVPCLLVLISTSTRAAPLYVARAETASGFGPTQAFQSTEPVFATAGLLFLPSGGTGTMEASAMAGPGVLRVSAEATINVPGSGLGGNGSVAAAESRLLLQDIMISPLPGTTPAATAPISLSLTLSGSLDTLANIGSPHIGFSEGGATISVLGNLAGTGFSGTRQKISQANASTGAVTNFEITGTGILAGSSSVVVTQEVMVPVDTPFILDLTISSIATARWNFGGTTTASTAALATAHASYFSDSLTLGANGQVFNLPAGYTANSLDGTIVDNQVVPEPSTVAALISGCIMMAGFGRGGRRVSSRSFGSFGGSPAAVG